jgi:SWI/SNF-related matrix-associated actin-dependent regulator 1 of chromatin subfamily A
MSEDIKDQSIDSPDKENIAELPTRWIGHCVFCGRELARSTSIEAFSGDVCRSRYGSIVDMSLVLNPFYDKNAFNLAMQEAMIEVEQDCDKIDISNQILRHLSRGLPVSQAQGALKALEALGYRGLARVVGSALNIKGWNGASLDQASADLENGLIILKSGYCEKSLTDIRAIPGRRWDSIKRCNYFAGTPIAAKMILSLCEVWFPFCKISDAIKELATKLDTTVPLSTPIVKDNKTFVRVNSQGNIEIKTSRFIGAFVDELKYRVPGRGKSWDGLKKVWEVNSEYVDTVFDVVNKFYKPPIDVVEYDPALDALKNKVATEKELSRATTVDAENEVILPGGKLYPFQSAGVLFLESKITNQGGVIIGDDMGLGKTMQFLAFVDRDRAHRLPALVVCPANVKLNWARKTKTWLNHGIKCAIVESNYMIEIDEHGMKDRHLKINMNMVTTPPDILITNYDLLKKHQEKFKSFKFETICFDESHFLKEYKSGRSKAARELAELIPRRALLSGTAMLNRTRELFHQLHICNPKVWGSFKPYGWRYCDPQVVKTPRGPVTVYNGASNLDELRDRLMGHFMIRRTKAEVLKDLPDKTTFQTYLDIPKEDRSEYDFARNDFLQWAFNVGGQEKLNSVARAEIVARITTLKRLCALAKVNTVADYCMEWLSSNEDEQLLLFAHHTEVIETISEILKTNGIATETIIGGDNLNNRQQVMDNFVAKKTRVIIASILAAGVGTDGLQCCQNMKVIERTWRPADMRQMEDRIHRIGQDKPCFVEYLDMEHSIDNHISKMIERKMKIIDQVLDGKLPPESGDIALEVYDSILNEEQPKRDLK